MPREPRDDHPGALQHVFSHALQQQPLFRDWRDKKYFLKGVHRFLPDCGVRVLAWVCMTTHFHLLVQTGSRPLGEAMHRLNTSYGVYFNGRHKRRGYVYWGRYGNRRIPDEDDLLNTLRYVHLNPVSAGILGSVEELSEYPWTGHAALMGRRTCEFLQVEEVLTWFGRDPVTARQALCDWMKKKGNAPSTSALESLFDWGDLVRAEAEEWLDRRERLLENGWDCPTAVRWICGRLDVSEVALCLGRRSRQLAEARALCAYVCVFELGARRAEISLHLGIGATAIPAAARRGARKVDDDRKLTKPLLPLRPPD